MDLEHLDTELKSQNYYIIIKNLYECEQTNSAYEWALKKCDEGHVPLWYFIIRYYYKNNFDNARGDTVFNAWKMALKSLILSMMYISTCKEINKRFYIIDILTKKYEEKFSNIITPKLFEQSLQSVFKYFKKKMDSNYIFPDPYWTYTCYKGGFLQSALQFRTNIPDSDLETIKNNFETEPILIKDNMEEAIEQSKVKIYSILQHFKKTGKLELTKGFSGDLLLGDNPEFSFWIFK